MFATPKRSVDFTSSTLARYSRSLVFHSMFDPGVATQLVLLLHAEAPIVGPELPIEVRSTLSPAVDRARFAAVIAEIPGRFLLGIRWVTVGRRGPWRGRELFELRLRPWWSRRGLRFDIRFGALARWS